MYFNSKLLQHKILYGFLIRSRSRSKVLIPNDILSIRKEMTKDLEKHIFKNKALKTFKKSKNHNSEYNDRKYILSGPFCARNNIG